MSSTAEVLAPATEDGMVSQILLMPSIYYLINLYATSGVFVARVSGNPEEGARPG